MNPGDTAMVEAGQYDERVVMTKSGQLGKPISFNAERDGFVRIQGFQIAADYVKVAGFDITNQNQRPQQGWGVYLIGSHNLITHNHIHDLCFEGIYISGNGDPGSPGTTNNVVSNNTIMRVQMAGARIEGRANLVEHNDVGFTRQYPPNCPARNGADADGFRFFGDGHRFVGNRVHDIDVPGTLYNLNPHTDCFQTWMTATHMIFDGNWCQMPAPYVNRSRAGNEIGSIENAHGYVADLLFMNNVFINMGQGLIVQGDGSGPIIGLRFFNNTLVNVVQEGLILKNVSRARIINNIFYDVGRGADNYLIADRASADIAAERNDMYLPSGSAPGLYGSSMQALNLDPEFAGADTLNLHLRSASGLIGIGANLPEVRTDFDGMPRPRNGAYDIGALQHH